MFYKKVFLNNSQNSVSAFFLIFLKKKEAPKKVFNCEFCKIFKGNFFIEDL